MKKFLGLLWLALILVISACGTDDKEESNGDKEDNNEESGEAISLYDKVKEEGVIKVGTEGTYAPFTFHNEDDKLTGYDVEVMREIAKRLELEVDFQETQWDSMFAGLNSKRFDVIANQVGINPDRLENYAFSIPYTISSAVVVVPKESTEITSFEDLKGKKSAQSVTSNFGAIAEENGAELVGVEGLAQAIELIKQDRVDVTVNDRLAVLDYINQQPDAGIKIAVREEDVSKTAFAFRKGSDELVKAFNEQLEAMRKDGTLAKISEKWFGEDVSQ